MLLGYCKGHHLEVRWKTCIGQGMGKRAMELRALSGCATLQHTDVCPNLESPQTLLCRSSVEVS